MTDIDVRGLADLDPDETLEAIVVQVAEGQSLNPDGLTVERFVVVAVATPDKIVHLCLDTHSAGLVAEQLADRVLANLEADDDDGPT